MYVFAIIRSTRLSVRKKMCSSALSVSYRMDIKITKWIAFTM